MEQNPILLVYLIILQFRLNLDCLDPDDFRAKVLAKGYGISILARQLPKRTNHINAISSVNACLNLDCLDPDRFCVKVLAKV